MSISINDCSRDVKVCSGNASVVTRSREMRGSWKGEPQGRVEVQGEAGRKTKQNSEGTESLSAVLFSLAAFL